MTDKTPFQRVVDELTAGCGCACHTGTGYRSSCEHCHVDGRLANSSGPIAPSMWGVSDVDAPNAAAAGQAFDSAAATGTPAACGGHQ